MVPDGNAEQHLANASVLRDMEVIPNLQPSFCLTTVTKVMCHIPNIKANSTCFSLCEDSWHFFGGWVWLECAPH